MSRIYTTPEGQHADEHLDAVYKEVFEGWPDFQYDDMLAFDTLINPYIKLIHDKVEIPFLDAVNNLDTAIRWANLLGRIVVENDSRNELRSRIPIEHQRDAKYFVLVGTGDNSAWAYGQCVHQAVLLGGLTVLREYAFKVLNQGNATAN